MNPAFLPILCERNALWIPAYAGMTVWGSKNVSLKEVPFALVFPL
jgi:hypothetical protein